MTFEIGFVPFNPDGWGPPDPLPLRRRRGIRRRQHPVRPLLPLREARLHSRLDPQLQLQPLLPRPRLLLRLRLHPRRSPSPRRRRRLLLPPRRRPPPSPPPLRLPLALPAPPPAPPAPRRGGRGQAPRGRQGPRPPRQALPPEPPQPQPQLPPRRAPPQPRPRQPGLQVLRRHPAGVDDARPDPPLQLHQASFSVPDPPEDLLVCGALEFYDRTFDRVTPRNDRRLDRSKSRGFFRITTTDDPVIRRLANEDKATVFATDVILSALMCVPAPSTPGTSSSRGSGTSFFDSEGSQLDRLSVHETSQEVLPDAKEDINSAPSLADEATVINQNFSQQVLVHDGNKVTFEEPNPFAAEGDDVASVAYRYRRWKLDDDMSLIARCEVHCVSDVKGQRSFFTLNALNEFDPKYTGVDWRQKLEAQRGAVLATELKNNGNKVAKWTAQALLASADVMKLGYVSRVHPRDRYNHTILSVVGYKPKDFAAQINLNTSNMWGIVKSIVDLCMKLNEGKYVLVKDPVKPQVRIYEVPPDAFENDYMEEPLPEEEQVQPPTEEEDAERVMDAVAEAEASRALEEGKVEKEATAASVV
ncbi:uncharacterized protein M6B38_313475 [Iris pallida]|uniref:Eukaryotic translation initiation factor 3 subunit 7 n=1 Tax=Iris pallida TaxID=29817 RepID=A0AAX6HG05_IRIPA|nr:uncharacterized protein M6B38_313475 [Iris pallida]